MPESVSPCGRVQSPIEISNGSSRSGYWPRVRRLHSKFRFDKLLDWFSPLSQQKRGAFSPSSRYRRTPSQSLDLNAVRRSLKVLGLLSTNVDHFAGWRSLPHWTISHQWTRSAPSGHQRRAQGADGIVDGEQPYVVPEGVALSLIGFQPQLLFGNQPDRFAVQFQLAGHFPEWLAWFPFQSLLKFLTNTAHIDRPFSAAPGTVFCMSELMEAFHGARDSWFWNSKQSHYLTLTNSALRRSNYAASYTRHATAPATLHRF